MEVRKICQWCGKPFIAQKTTTCYCSHQCSNLGYKERIREHKRQLKRSQELLQPRQAAEGQDFFSFAQAAKLMGVTRQYIYKLVKESKLRASRLSGKKSLIRRADIELMMKTKPYEVNAKWVWTYTRQHKVPKVRIRQFNYYSKKHIDAVFAKSTKSFLSVILSFIALCSLNFKMFFRFKSIHKVLIRKNISHLVTD